MSRQAFEKKELISSHYSDAKLSSVELLDNRRRFIMKTVNKRLQLHERIFSTGRMYTSEVAYLTSRRDVFENAGIRIPCCCHADALHSRLTGEIQTTVLMEDLGDLKIHAVCELLTDARISLVLWKIATFHGTNWGDVESKRVHFYERIVIGSKNPWVPYLYRKSFAVKRFMR